jgi:hypothetical protein
MILTGGIVGALLFLVITIFTPWPDFIAGWANALLAIPESAGDVVWEYFLKTLGIFLGYIMFPAVGACIGVLVGYIINRRYD